MVYTAPVGGVVHAIFVPVMALLGVPVLAWFHVGSAVTYTVAAIAYRRGWVRLADWLVIAEVIAHGILGTREVGWQAGLQLPVLVVAAAYVGAPRASKSDKIVWSLAALGSLLATPFYPPPRVTLPTPTLYGIYFAAVTITFALIVFIMRMLDGTADALERELAQERERIEVILKREVSHQVAERSRELGQALVRGADTVQVSLPTVGETFHTRYHVVRQLGAGGMGAVFEVERITDQKRFALKVLTGVVSAAEAARFAREAEIGALIHDANLVSIVDVGVTNGTPFLVMEMASDGSLEDCRSRFGDTAWALPILKQIARGLDALHKSGIIHRDLKPANVLMDGTTIRISDFGISRLETSSSGADAMAATIDALTRTGILLGTPQYMAPEAARGGRNIQPSADVFAFGIIAYELLTKRTPFAIPPVLLAVAQQQLPAVDLVGGIDARAAAAIRACVAEDAVARPSAAAIVEALG
jgi:hypothetical protein